MRSTLGGTASANRPWVKHAIDCPTFKVKSEKSRKMPPPAARRAPVLPVTQAPVGPPLDPRTRPNGHFGRPAAPCHPPHRRQGTSDGLPDEVIPPRVSRTTGEVREARGPAPRTRPMWIDAIRSRRRSADGRDHAWNRVAIFHSTRRDSRAGEPGPGHRHCSRLSARTAVKARSSHLATSLKRARVPHSPSRGNARGASNESAGRVVSDDGDETSRGRMRAVPEPRTRACAATCGRRVRPHQ